MGTARWGWGGGGRWRGSVHLNAAAGAVPSCPTRPPAANAAAAAPSPAPLPYGDARDPEPQAANCGVLSSAPPNARCLGRSFSASARADDPTWRHAALAPPQRDHAVPHACQRRVRRPRSPPGQRAPRDLGHQAAASGAPPVWRPLQLPHAEVAWLKDETVRVKVKASMRTDAAGLATQELKTSMQTEVQGLAAGGCIRSEKGSGTCSRQRIGPFQACNCKARGMGDGLCMHAYPFCRWGVWACLPASARTVLRARLPACLHA
eukprot:358334-Chlamydomonas_euryale.AAC.5